MSLDEQLPPPPGHQGFPPPQPPQQGTSGLAIAGLILAFLVAPIGFILSLIAIFKTGAGKAKGRGLAIAGLIVSVLVIGGFTAIVVAAANSTVADPGCTSGKQAILDNASNTDPTNLQPVIDQLNAAAAKAKHADVRNAMKAIADDYTQVQNGTKTGQMPPGILDKIKTDAQKVDDLCTVGS